jgi:large subunit ribosomal protein L15
MLDRLKPRERSRRPRRRDGRGIGSGNGRTCGRGQKGAGARSGNRRRGYREGGQNPLARRLPKVGFHNPFRDPPGVVNVKDLARFPKGTAVTAGLLAEAGLIRPGDRRVKVLGEGEIQVALSVQVHAISGAARQKIEGAGGTVEILPAKSKGPKSTGGGASK